jgi:hypothetical protein
MLPRSPCTIPTKGPANPSPITSDDPASDNNQRRNGHDAGKPNNLLTIPVRMDARDADLTNLQRQGCWHPELSHTDLQARQATRACFRQRVTINTQPCDPDRDLNRPTHQYTVQIGSQTSLLDSNIAPLQDASTAFVHDPVGRWIGATSIPRLQFLKALWLMHHCTNAFSTRTFEYDLAALLRKSDPTTAQSSSPPKRDMAHDLFPTTSTQVMFGSLIECPLSATRYFTGDPEDSPFLPNHRIPIRAHGSELPG